MIERRWLIGGLTALVLTLAVHALVIGGKPVVRLGQASALGGIIAQSLGTTDRALPQENKDFTITDLHYFGGRAWVVATVKQKDAGNDGSAVLVLKSSSGSYDVVLGPGTAFPKSYLQSLPSDVGQYVSERAASYEPVN